MSLVGSRAGMQLALVWAVPLVGAILVISVLARNGFGPDLAGRPLDALHTTFDNPLSLRAAHAV
jgi:hypothetical protein